MAPCDLNVSVSRAKGDIVEGTLRVVVRSHVNITKLIVTIEGSSISNLATKKGQDPTPITRTERHTIVHDSVTISAKYTELSTGEYKLPFSLSLPSVTQCKSSAKGQFHVYGPLPPSFTSPHLQVHYKLSVTLHVKKSSVFGASKLHKTLMIPLSPSQVVPPNMTKSTIIQQRFTIPPLPEPPKSFISYLFTPTAPPPSDRPLIMEMRSTGVLQLGGSLPIDLSFVSKAVRSMYLHKITISIRSIITVKAKELRQTIENWLTLCDVICTERLKLTEGRAIVPKHIYDSVVAGMSKSFKVCNGETHYELHVTCEVSGQAAETSKKVHVMKPVMLVEHDLPSYEEAVGPQITSPGILKTSN